MPDRDSGAVDGTGSGHQPTKIAARCGQVEHRPGHDAQRQGRRGGDREHDRGRQTGHADGRAVRAGGEKYISTMTRR